MRIIGSSNSAARAKLNIISKRVNNQRRGGNCGKFQSINRRYSAFLPSNYSAYVCSALPRSSGTSLQLRSNAEIARQLTCWCHQDCPSAGRPEAKYGNPHQPRTPQAMPPNVPWLRVLPNIVADRCHFSDLAPIVTHSCVFRPCSAGKKCVIK